MPWPVAQKVLKRIGVRRSRGWDNTLKAVNDAGVRPDREDELIRALQEHLLCGEKLVQFYQLDDEMMNALRYSLLLMELPKNIFSAIYPMQVDADEVRAGDHTRPVLAEVARLPFGSALIFASIRHTTSRESLGLGDLPAEAAEALSGYAEVIGVRRQKLEAIDVLWIPDEGNTIELRVDFPWGMLQEQGKVALANLAAACIATLGRDYLSNQVNLFPAIQSLYDKEGDGSMVELGFMVSGSAQKLEKSRRDGHCCRTEAYHVGGKQALAMPIQPYRVSVIWPEADGENESRAEVSLNGTSLMTADPEAFLGSMTVRNCADLTEYQYLRERMLEHLAV